LPPLPGYAVVPVLRRIRFLGERFAVDFLGAALLILLLFFFVDFFFLVAMSVAPSLRRAQSCFANSPGRPEGETAVDLSIESRQPARLRVAELRALKQYLPF
jgi:hypothetical protein